MLVLGASIVFITFCKRSNLHFQKTLEEFTSQAQHSLVSLINELQRVAGFLCELAEQRGPPRLYTNQLAVTQVALTFGLDFTTLHSAFLVRRRPTHPTCRCTEARVLLRGTNVHVPLLFFSTFRQTVLGVVSGLNPAARLSKARFEVVCDAAVQADIQVLDLLFLFGQASVKQLMAASHSLVKCSCGPGATPLSADAETAGGVTARLIKGNAITSQGRGQQTDRHQGRSGELLRPARR